jgi:GntP family gluconate:H+ symporter
MPDAHSAVLLALAIGAVVALILLVTVVKLNPLLTLLMVSLGLGLAAGMAPQTIVQSFEQGAGQVLGHIAIVVALGAMLGKMLAVSGGAEVIAERLVRFFGERRIHWAMLAIGLLVGLPTFFEVGFVLLVPLLMTIARRTGTKILLVALPAVAGLSIVHGLVPPHPAAMLAVTIFHADVGRTILFGLLVGIPAAILAGPVYARFLAPRLKLAEDAVATHVEPGKSERRPSFALTLATILLPILLMVIGSLADAFTGSGSVLNQTLHFIGNDDLALLIGVIGSFYTLGICCGFTHTTILRFSQECLAPTATILLLVGAGGGFGKILAASGVSEAVTSLALQAHLPLLVLAWLLAALMRLATGSATVALSTAAGIIAPLALHSPGVHPELLVLACGSGALIFSHVNDAGFWLVKEMLGLTVVETLKSWSIVETILSVAGLGGTLLLAVIL